MNKRVILLGLASIFTTLSIFFVQYTKAEEPKELYHVYLKGDTIGFIKSKTLLEEYIDKEQGELKEKYGVDKVYAPNDLDIIKEVTFEKNILDEKEIYEKIKNISPFTINGYTITIKGFEELSETEGETTREDRYVYTTKKELFEQAVKNTILAFIQEDDYNNFINGTQQEIKDVGTIIEDIYIKNEITIKEGRISVEEQIITTIEDMNKYMLFGTLGEQQKYVVQEGDVISDIAYNNRLSPEEFLIANPEFKSVNNLLYAGQVVNLGLINPLFDLIEEDHVVELQPNNFDTKIEYDDNMLIGTEKVIQEGVDGIDKITKKVQKANGEIKSAIIAGTEIIKPSVSKIIVKGKKQIPTVGDLGVWAWPTAKPYLLTSPYGWRWGKLHEGIDISGTGCGSPIYAANNGIVTIATYSSVNGNYIYIDHNNGYFTVYAHLASMNVVAGQAVGMGDKIGTMGQTGYAFGCHLHYSVSRGRPFSTGSQFINPMGLY